MRQHITSNRLKRSHAEALERKEEMSVPGKVALVTGATRGIGLSVARRFSQEGMTLSLCGRDEEALSHLQEEFGKENFSCHVSKADILNSDQVREMVEKTLDKFGKIDILVNNAGVTADDLLVRMKETEWQRVLETNLTGAFRVTHLVAKEMIKAHYGRIINISSIIGIMGNTGQTAYASSKAGLLGFTKSVARELAPRGITCNAVAPGFIETDMTHALPETVQKEILSRIPLGRLGRAEEVAEVVQFLASDDARYVTGQTIRVDGGMVTS